MHVQMNIINKTNNNKDLITNKLSFDMLTFKSIFNEGLKTNKLGVLSILYLLELRQFDLPTLFLSHFVCLFNSTCLPIIHWVWHHSIHTGLKSQEDMSIRKSSISLSSAGITDLYRKLNSEFHFYTFRINIYIRCSVG